MTTLPDEQLILAAQNGSREAVAVLYQRHLQFLLNASRTYAGGYLEPFDLVHEAWLRILNDLHRFTPRKSFRAWAVTVVRNLGRDTATRRSRCRELLDQHRYDLIADGGDGRQETEESDRKEWVEGALESLTPRQQQALRMHVGERCTSIEVGHRMGCKPPTVRTTCHFALTRVRETIAAG